MAVHEVAGVKLCAIDGDHYDSREKLAEHIREVDSVFELTGCVDYLIDVGACNGITSAIALKRGHAQWAHLIEPSSSNFESLLRTISLNGISPYTAMYNCAIQRDPAMGAKVLYSTPRNSGASTVNRYREKRLSQLQDALAVEETVECERLNMVVGDVFGRLVVWVDCQGSEFDVLDSFPTYTETGSHWYIEFAPNLFEDYYEKPDLIAECFSKMWVRKNPCDKLEEHDVKGFKRLYESWKRTGVRRFHALFEV
jgi:FkbM family methyltransferase